MKPTTAAGQPARVLGIETSCDETSAAIVAGTGAAAALRSLVILSQDAHTVFGGVVPEIASRMHLTSIVPVVGRAIQDAGLTATDVDAVAVTYTPGLIGALLVGVCYAKALAFALDRPLVPVHHLEAHLFATALEHAGRRAAVYRAARVWRAYHAHRCSSVGTTIGYSERRATTPRAKHSIRLPSSWVFRIPAGDTWRRLRC